MEDVDSYRGEGRWVGPEGVLGRYISEESTKTLESYRVQPTRVDEDARAEQDAARGGYQRRQLLELVQNSADALSPDVSCIGPLSPGDEQGAFRCESSPGADVPAVQDGGRIEVRLTEDCLYCADDGAPIDENGVRSLMFSRLSPKRATGQIGMFGLGFKSVLGVSDEPEFFSRSGSFRFDPAGSRDRIRAGVPGTEHAAFLRFPVLRLPEPIEPSECAAGDDVLRDLMGWAVNIVRLRPETWRVRGSRSADARIPVRILAVRPACCEAHTDRRLPELQSGDRSSVWE